MEYKKALEKAQKFCAYQERAPQDVINRLSRWGIFPQQIDEIMERLKEDQFLDEKRFARVFTQDKFNFQKWGRYKIRAKLKEKNIPESTISWAIEQINEEKYRQVLAELAEKKLRLIKGDDKYARGQKLAQYLLARGFESDLVWDIARPD